MDYPGNTTPQNEDDQLLTLKKMLLALNNGGGGGGGGSVTQGTVPWVVSQSGVARTLTSTTATSSGTVSAGAKSVSFATSSDWSGSINGATRGASLTFSISVVNPGDTLPAIAYVQSAGTLYIDVLT